MVIAHQGGWDEILAVVGPLLLIAGLLMVANRRAGRLRAKATDDEHARDQGDPSP